MSSSSWKGKGKKNFRNNSYRETRRKKRGSKNKRGLIVNDRRKLKDLNARRIFKSRTRRGGTGSSRKSWRRKSETRSLSRRRGIVRICDCNRRFWKKLNLRSNPGWLTSKGKRTSNLKNWPNLVNIRSLPTSSGDLTTALASNSKHRPRSRIWMPQPWLARSDRRWMGSLATV